MTTTSPPPMPPPSSSSLRDLLEKERCESHALAAAPRRPRSGRHASPPLQRVAPEEEDDGEGGGGAEAVGAVVAMLSGYVGRFVKDEGFRRGLREKCAACLAPAASRRGAGHAVLANLELGIESIERLAADAASAQAQQRDAKIRSLRNSIRLLSVVASLHAPPPPRHAAPAPAAAEAHTCGVPNSHLSACAQLYLSVVYKMERNDHVSARHLLQVFVDAPYLARKNLLPDLWDHVFLPHLLHLKVWFTAEADLAADDRSRRMKTLQRLYNDHLNSGTAQFAIYYKEWLKSGGAEAPPPPSVPLPSMPGDFDAWDKHSSSLRRSSINRGLWVKEIAISFFLFSFLNESLLCDFVSRLSEFCRYNAVFGTAMEQEDVKDAKLDDDEMSQLVLETDVELEDNPGCLKMGRIAHCGDKKIFVCISSYLSARRLGLIRYLAASKLNTVSFVPHLIYSCQRRQSNMGLQEKHSVIRKEPETAPTPRKSYSLRLFSCRGDLTRNVINHPKIPKKEAVSVEKELECSELTINLERAVSMVSSSDSLTQCEYAVQEVARACSNLREDPNLGTWLSCPSFIQGLLEVTFTSKDDLVLECAILIIGELILSNEVNRQIVLNADPQLEVFLRLLRSKELFLKAAIVLYLMKPKAKQMLSLDWIPLVLQILECGDEVQFLSSVKCAPKVAALYFLDQLLMGFDVDRNVENAKQMIALGGLDLLMNRIDGSDSRESKKCISLLTSCIQADGSCRHYLVDNLKKEPIVQLLVGNQKKASSAALNLLSELVCLNRTTQILEFLKELKNGGCLNTMHILLVYLQQAPIAQHPLAAVMLLQLDLLGDSSQYSVYREEAIDAMVAALEHGSHSRKLQEQCARALLLLAGRFSSSGEPIAEAWLLKRAGLDDSLSESFRRTEIFKDKSARVEEEKIVEERLKKLALMLLNSGNKKFLTALSNCISDGIPSLARACLITVTWMSSSLSPLHGCNTFQPLACSILATKLVDSLSYDRALEERVLASLSLLNLVRHPECLEKLYPLKKDTVESLQDLAEVTWTAKELLFACCR
uniref:E3 ubiquitin-protein ligase LIN n=1 Tax=Oryza meridionalis TaxID=40149 RepID=A0A0E0CG90_9ORYZ